MPKNFFSDNFAKVREINRRYATPNIEMSKGVKFALLSLRLYLIFLVLLLVYKFITLIR
ncbi:MAG: hypothetical protein ABSG42_04945 [Nitrospirota bacterium]